uniref:thioredoxin domain-containing protein n=1 Tax=Prevotella sp. TaxID=59823 RepID=UPI0025E8F53D
MKTKKIMASLLLGLATLPVAAQTDFRKISFDEAMQAAQKEKKLVFIDFYTDWCGPCKMMSREVFPQKKVGDYFNAKFVCLKLNAEKEGAELAKRYKVKAYPTYVVLDSDGKQRMEASGAMKADEFLDKIESGIDPNRSPERMKQLYDKGKRTPDLINRYALYLMEQRKEKEGFKVIDDYFTGLSDAKRLQADNAFLYTRYTLNLDNDRARFMVANLDKFDKKTKPQIEARIQQLYHNALTSYFSGYLLREKKYNEADYQKLKSEIIGLHLDDKYEYAPMFRLIESRVKDDDTTFLAHCNEEYDKLNPRDKTLLVLNLTRLIDSKDKEVLKQISTFIRSRLSTMEANTISLAGRLLSSIEEMDS